MADKNIQIRHKKDGKWESLFPYTLSENIYDEQGKAEIVTAREGEENLSTRLEKDFNEVTNQINKTADSIPFTIKGTPPFSSGLKSLYRRAPNTYILTTPSANKKDFLQFAFEKNSGAAADASNYGANHELLRLVGVYNGDRHSFHYVWKRPTEFSGPNYTEQEFNSPNYASPEQLLSISNNGTDRTGTNHLEFPVDVDKLENKELSLIFFPSGITSDAVEVSVDGEILGTVNSRTSIYTVRKADLSNVDGEVTVRLTPTGNRTTMHFLGYNAYKIQEAPKNLEYNAGVTILSAGDHYIQSAGANDYALKERGGKWMGSFHGGETSLSLEILMDNENVSNMDVGEMKFGGRFQLIQKTNLINKITTNSITTIDGNGVFEFEAFFEVLQPFEVSDFYIAMTCSRTSFDKIVNPVIRNKITEGDTVVPATGKITQQDTTNNNQITTIYNIESDYFGERNVYVRLNSSYAKFYHGKVVGDSYFIEDIAFSSIKIFH